MNMNFRGIVSISILMINSTAMAQVEVDRCRTVAQLLGRDESQSTYELKISEEIYSNICNGENTKSSLDFNGSASFMVDMIPASKSIGFGTKEEKAKYFCSTYQSSKNTQIYQSGVSSTVVREAIDAWLQCAVLNKDVFVNIKPTQSPASFFFDLKRGAEDSFFKGIKVTEGTLNCVATTIDNSGNSVSREINRDTVIKLTPDTLSVSCARPSETTLDGFNYIPQTTFLIDTSRGSIPVSLPRDARLGPVYASDLANQISILRNQDAEIQRRILNRDIEFVRNCSPLDRMERISPPACPANYKVAFYDVFSYTGGSHGIGQHCTVCYRMMGGN